MGPQRPSEAGPGLAMGPSLQNSVQEQASVTAALQRPSPSPGGTHPRENFQHWGFPGEAGCSPRLPQNPASLPFLRGALTLRPVSTCRCFPSSGQAADANRYRCSGFHPELLTVLWDNRSFKSFPGVSTIWPSLGTTASSFPLIFVVVSELREVGRQPQMRNTCFVEERL